VQGGGERVQGVGETALLPLHWRGMCAQHYAPPAAHQRSRAPPHACSWNSQPLRHAPKYSELWVVADALPRPNAVLLHAATQHLLLMRVPIAAKPHLEDGRSGGGAAASAGRCVQRRLSLQHSHARAAEEKILPTAVAEVQKLQFFGGDAPRATWWAGGVCASSLISHTRALRLLLRCCCCCCCCCSDGSHACGGDWRLRLHRRRSHCRAMRGWAHAALPRAGHERRVAHIAPAARAF